jgi:hypothetical protein
VESDVEDGEGKKKQTMARGRAVWCTAVSKGKVWSGHVKQQAASKLDGLPMELLRRQGINS